MFGVDGQVAPCLRVGEPRQLHDRTPGRVENDPFYVLDVALDAVPVSSNDDDLRRGGRGLRLALARGHWSGWRVMAALRRGDGTRFIGSASMEEGIDPSALKDLHCYACRGATVLGASGVAAREVLLADEANLLPNVLPRRPGKEPDDPLRCQSGWGVRVDLRVA